MNVRLLFATTVTLCVPVLAQVQTPPTFQTAINYVEFSVRVVDARGNFVRDLQQADFQVLEDQQLQNIARFELVDLPLPDRKARTSSSALASEPLSTEGLQQLGGRLYVFLLDDHHLTSEHSTRAKSVVGTFIREQMGATDAAAILFASGGQGQLFTQDGKLLLSAVNRLRGSYDYRAPAQVKELKARAVIQTMTDLAAALAPIQGRRKVLVYVGTTVGCLAAQEGIPNSDRGFIVDRGQANLSSAGTGEADDASGQLICREEIRQAVRNLMRAGVVVYSVDPRTSHNPAWVSPTVDGRGGPGPARERMTLVESRRPSVFDGFFIIADQTGGFAVTGTSALNPVFDRIVQENSSYYLVGYYSTNEAAKGEFRSNEIKLGRERLKAVYRPGYFAPR